MTERERLPDRRHCVAGLRVNLADDCTCGARETVIGDDRKLRCVGCGESRGRLGPRATAFITEIINKFGRPTAPITLRRAIGHVESLDLIMQPADSGRLMDDWRTRRRQFGRRAIFDMATLEEVWAYFPSGGAPDIVAAPAGQDPGDAPTEKHKKSVRLRVKMSDNLGGDVRECISLAAGFWYAADDLHNRYLSELPQHPGQLPIVSISEMVETKTKQGSAKYAPKFEIDGWIGRPGDLPSTPPPPITKKPAQISAPKPKPAKNDMDDEIPF